MGNTATGAQRAIARKAKIEVMVMRIVTRFATVDEFVTAFRKFCSKSTCFIPSAVAKKIGIETGFSIRLADGTPMLRGLCVVLDSWTTDENPYGRPGVRLGIRSLTAESQPVFKRLVLAGATPAQGVDVENARPTIKMEALFPAPVEERAPGSTFVLPANPLSEMTDDSLQAFVDCTMTEDAERALIDTVDGVPEILGGGDGPDGESTVRISEGTERVDTTPKPARPTTQIETVLEGMDLGGLHRATQMLRAEDLVPPTTHVEPVVPAAPMIPVDNVAAATPLIPGDIVAAATPLVPAAPVLPVATADVTVPTASTVVTAPITADMTVPTPAPPILPALDAALMQLDPLPRASRASEHPRLTRLGVEPFEKPRPRERISMPAITEADAVPVAVPVEVRPFPPPPAHAEPTAIVARYAEPTTLWMRLTRRVRAWVRRVKWARRRRAALRG